MRKPSKALQIRRKREDKKSTYRSPLVCAVHYLSEARHVTKILAIASMRHWPKIKLCLENY